MNLKLYILVFRYLRNSISFKRIVNKCYFSTNKPKYQFQNNSGNDNNSGNNNNSGNDNNSKKDYPERNYKSKLDNR